MKKKIKKKADVYFKGPNGNDNMNNKYCTLCSYHNRKAKALIDQIINDIVTVFVPIKLSVDKLVRRHGSKIKTIEVGGFRVSLPFFFTDFDTLIRSVWVYSIRKVCLFKIKLPTDTG